MMSFISKPDLVQISFSALTLLVGLQAVHPACKNGVMTCWYGCLSGVQMMCIWSSWCHCHPIVSCEIKTQNGLSFWCPFTHIFVEKRLLNDCFYLCSWDRRLILFPIRRLLPTWILKMTVLTFNNGQNEHVECAHKISAWYPKLYCIYVKIKKKNSTAVATMLNFTRMK